MQDSVVTSILRQRSLLSSSFLEPRIANEITSINIQLKIDFAKPIHTHDYGIRKSEVSENFPEYYYTSTSVIC